MATDIKISELNEITSNNDINHIIINDRENPGDEGITKKIKLENFLTPNIVQETNILDSAVTCDKIKPLAVDCTRITSKTITCNQIKECTINNPLLDSNSVDSRVLNNDCGFTVKCLTVCNGAVNINNGLNGCLIVESGRTKLNTQTYTWPQSETADRFLKTDGAGNLSWDQAVPGESTALVFAEIMPVGTVVPWAGTGTVPDDKWLECNGNTFKGYDYPDLRDALGDIWGTHVGDDYFLPDLKGRVAVGSGTGNDGTNSCAFAVGTSGGEYNNTLEMCEIPNVTGSVFLHRTQVGSCDGVFSTTQDLRGLQPYVGNSTAGGDGPVNIKFNLGGGGQAHNNIQPYAVTRYIIKAKPDDIQQFDMNVGPGLSALNASGGQTASIDLSSSEIGLKVSDDFEFDGAGILTLNDNVSASSIRFDDGTLQSTYEKAAFYTLEVAGANNYTTPSQFTGNIISKSSEYSKGTISTGTNNKTYTSNNSLLYTMSVKVLANTTVTLYNYVNDDAFYVYVDGTLEYTGNTNYNSANSPRVVTFNLTTGNRKVQIVKNDSGGGSNSFDLLGDIIGTNVLFLSGN